MKNLKIDIIIFIILLFAFTLIAEDNFHFAILGDRTSAADQEAFELVVKEMSNLRPDFVVTVGDLAEDGRILSDWDVPMETMKTFECPVYYTPGNHDIYDEASAKTFTEKTGNDPYYSFDYGNTHFIILDNSTVSNYEEMDEIQIEWFTEDLQRNKDKTNIYVFMHKPFWANAIAEGKEDFMHDLFKEYNVDVVFTGHWHQYAYNEIDGIEYYLVGSSGGGMPAENDDLGIFYQYLWCKVEADKIHTSLIKAGNMFPKDLVTIQEEQISYNISRKFIQTKSTIEDDSKPDEFNVQISIYNDTEKSINENIEIDSKENWLVYESVIPVSIQPGDTLKTEFTIIKQGNFFPLPVVKFVYPFGREKQYEYEEPLNITRIIQSTEVKKIPEIDGKITKKEKKEAFIIDEFGDEEGEISSLDKTQVFFLHNDEYLYIASICTEENTDSLKAVFTGRDEDVYYDDSMGFLLSTNGNVIYQFYVNLNEAIWDMRTDLKENKYDKEWNGNVKVKARIFNNSWIIEMKIPLTEIGFNKDLKEMKINFRRYRPYDEKAAFFIPEWRYNSVNLGKLRLD